MSERERAGSASEAQAEEERGPAGGGEAEGERPLDDAELQDVVGGASPDDYDRWHTLPDGSGSGHGE